MRRFIIWSGNHPWIVTALVLACTALAAGGIFRLRVDTSTRGMMVRDEAAREYYEETLKIFGTDNVTVLYIQDEDLFTPKKLKTLGDMVYALENLSGVERVESLFSVTNIKNVDGFLETYPLLDWIPETNEEAEQVRKDALDNPIFQENLISRDGRATAVNLYVKEDEKDPDFNVNFSRAVDDILETQGADFEVAFQVGLSYTRRLISENILEDQITLVPLSVAVLLLTLILTMRSLSGAVLPMLTAGTSMLWTAGFMGYVGIPINLLTVIVPSLIIVIGSTEDIHILSEYIEGIQEKKTRGLAVTFMAGKVGTAVMLTAITTFLGFLSITLNEIQMLKQFGVTASFGLFVNPLTTCLLAPVYLKYFGPLKSIRTGPERTNPVDAFIARIGEAILKIVKTRKKLVLTVLLGFATIIGLFLSGVRVDNDLLGYFKESSGIRARSRFLHKNLSGPQAFFIRITGEDEGAFKDPKNLARIQNAQQAMERMNIFDKTLSLADHISLIHQEMNDSDPEFHKVPESAELIPQYLILLHRDDIETLVSSDFSEANIVVRHGISSSHGLAQALDRLQILMRREMGPHFKFGFTGKNILLNKAADSMASAQAKSLSLLLIVIFVIMAILYVNVKAGLLSLVPNLFPIVINFGVMGLFGIPLNTGTAMVAAVAIGIAVDDTIHLMSRYHREMRILQNQQTAMEVCIRSEIRPVLSTSVALALGFAVLGFSGFVPVIFFGLLSAMVMIFALIADMFITPILLASTQLITLADMLALRLRKEVLTASKLFMGLRPWQIKKVVLLGRMLERDEGEDLVVENEYGKSMFILLEGNANVIKKKERNGEDIVLAVFGPGDIFGEIALVDPGPRSATVRAEKPVRYIEIDWESLNRIQRIYPRLAGKLFLNLARILGHRLADADKLISRLQ
ncbi:MAG: MMPL family transporter [Thermodesulfobacteriota bacterium]|nr:MMPL family transporter [Thermodesulfobacteriota bacterium]